MTRPPPIERRAFLFPALVRPESLSGSNVPQRCCLRWLRRRLCRGVIRVQGIPMSKGARTAVEICAGVKPGESVLVITDTSMMSIAEAVAGAVIAVGAEPVVAVMPPRATDGQEPPRPIAAAMKVCDAFFSVVSKSITHTRAVRDAATAGSRGIMLTQFTEEMLMSGGIEADFASLAPTCKAVAKAMEEATTIRLTTPAGTDLTISAAGRPGNALTCLVGPGQFSPIPNVEANVSPVEGSAEGIIVVDGRAFPTLE